MLQFVLVFTIYNPQQKRVRLLFNLISGLILLQDTVLGLQALSEFGFAASDHLDLFVDVNARDFSQSIHISRSDAMVLKLVDVCTLAYG